MPEIKNIVKAGLSNVLEAMMFFMTIYQAPISKKIMLAQFGEDFSSRGINTGIDRLCKKGFISKFKDKRNIFIKILSADKLWTGHTALKIKKSKNKWDGHWRLIIYDIPEKLKVEREHLRGVLGLLGFGKIQDSCWASPYDHSDFIYNFCKQRGIVDYVCLYEGKFFAGKDINALINEAWKLSEIKDNYLNIFNDSEELLNKIRMNRIGPKELRDSYVSIYNLFKLTIVSDPFLPQQFLEGWPFKKTEDSLNALAHEIFKAKISND